ncbi:MAG: segregation/condensation protein A [Alphaproteobacteria bacterium]|jgi:segregation and condensation protein A|nr:segregation/condensation protein A [Alphaproteobacteria bacterium]
MQDYRVELDVYHGPLDLLLYLIRRDEIDIHDIPISHITEQYLKYLETIRALDINLAGEFLVMAATLMEVKSAMLSPPTDEQDESGESGLTAADDPTDPRYELIHQLLAYKRFKDAAMDLDERRERFEARFARAPAEADRDHAPTVELDLEDVSLWDLVEAFSRMMDQVGLRRSEHEVVDDDTPIELHVTDLADRLGREGPMTLQQAFEGRRRGEMIGLFLAMLELVRQRRLHVRQPDPAAPIELALRDADEAQAELRAEAEAPEREPADPASPDDFAWPDEQTRHRYIKRLQRRAQGERVEEDEQLRADLAELEGREGHDEPDD